MGWPSTGTYQDWDQQVVVTRSGLGHLVTRKFSGWAVPISHMLCSYLCEFFTVFCSFLISNVRNGQNLLDRVRGSEPPSDAVFVFDILGNSSARFKQDDGGSSLPIKLNGSFHLMGELEMMQHEHVEQALSSIEHLYKTWLKTSCKIFNPPIPRYLFGSCCHDLAHGRNIRMGGHGEKMSGEHCRIRNNLKGILLKDGVRNMRVLNTLGTLTAQNTISEQLAALKPREAKDNVHLTTTGNKALAEGIFREAQNFGVTRSKGKHSL